METKARIIAFYLPQYHPIPENDQWWGKGFTEWTNVAKAKSLFKNHYQPRIPADLGFYDLRVPESRKAQADMAREYGIEGFCYWHYWFGNGKRLIERPFNEVISLKEPDFPFCLAWANETWKGFNHGLKNRNVLIEQLYPGVQDYTAHFYEVLGAFQDKRYITIDDKPVFMIYKPLADSQIPLFIETWRKLAIENNLPGIYFIGHSMDFTISEQTLLQTGVDAINTVRLNDFLADKKSYLRKFYKRYNKLFRNNIKAFPYEIASKKFISPEIDNKENVYPSLIPGWDHSPRSGGEGLVLTDATPELFEKHVKKALEIVKHKKEEHKIIFLKSWNEWAEGNYMEPDLRWGTKFLEALKNQLFK